ncbi:procollagen galactosyltransferase 2-like isoform X2 [Cynocephalus volans]|uniref:procollagen galactosyltransferase 2-like isoform X2 n=1 Tax=Cynocephalus volans TaxID=110931 RepID=UPI002FC9C07C
MAARPAATLAWSLLLLSSALLRGSCRARFAAEPDSEDDEEEAVAFPESPLQRPTVLVAVLAATLRTRCLTSSAVWSGWTTPRAGWTSDL